MVHQFILLILKFSLLSSPLPLGVLDGQNLVFVKKLKYPDLKSHIYIAYRNDNIISFLNPLISIHHYLILYIIQ